MRVGDRTVGLDGVGEVLRHPNVAVSEFGDEIFLIVTLIHQTILGAFGHGIEHIGAVGGAEIAEILHVIQIVNRHRLRDTRDGSEV